MIFLATLALVRRHFEYRAIVALQFFEKISATWFTWIWKETNNDKQKNHIISTKDDNGGRKR